MPSDLVNLLSGLPNGPLGNALSNLVQELSGMNNDLENLGENDIDIAGPEEEIQTEGYDDGDGTGAPRRRLFRVRSRKAKSTKVKQASPSTASQYSNLQMRMKRVEGTVIALSKALSAKRVLKTASLGNRAAFTATQAAVAAAAAATSTVAANAQAYYDRVFFLSNTPGLHSAVTSAQNPILDGSASMPTDAGQVVGPIELAEPIQLSGTSGVTGTFTNRGAAAGDGTVGFLPTGHSWGSAAPNAF